MEEQTSVPVSMIFELEQSLATNQHSAPHYRTCSKLDEIEKTWCIVFVLRRPVKSVSGTERWKCGC